MQLYINGKKKYMVPWSVYGNPQFPATISPQDKCVIRFPLEQLSKALQDQGYGPRAVLRARFRDNAGNAYWSGKAVFPVCDCESFTHVGKLRV
jgi:hypothetical protein